MGAAGAVDGLILRTTRRADQLHFLSVPEAASDPRFENNPLVSSNSHRVFYAGPRW